MSEHHLEFSCIITSGLCSPCHWQNHLARLFRLHHYTKWIMQSMPLARPSRLSRPPDYKWITKHIPWTRTLSGLFRLHHYKRITAVHAPHDWASATASLQVDYCSICTTRLGFSDCIITSRFLQYMSCSTRSWLLQLYDHTERKRIDAVHAGRGIIDQNASPTPS